MKFFGLEKILEKIERLTITEKGVSVELPEPFKKSWNDLAEKLIDELNNIENAVVVFDEFPAMIENFKETYPSKEIKAFLRWFEGVRNLHLDVRYVICGSVCLDFVVRELKVPDGFLDFKRYALRRMQKEKAAELFEKCLTGKGLIPTKEATERMLEKVDHLPWFVKLLAYDLNQRYIFNKGKEINTEDINISYKNILRYTEFNYYLDRLKKYSKEHYEVGKKLLYELSRGEGFSRKEFWGLYQYITRGDDEESFYHLIADLENDFYIKYDDKSGCFKFYSKVLRDWFREIVFKG